VVLLADRLDRAELEHGLAARFGSRHAGAEIVRRLLREMFLHLFAQTPIGAAAGCEVREACEKALQGLHDRSSPLTSKNRAMMAAVCSQSRVSVCNCLRPALVRR
jgi:hypothetical protein